MSQTELQVRAGRLPKPAFQRLVETGLLNEAGPDGRWAESELDRIDTVMELGSEARDLYRRVLRLSWTIWPVSGEHRRDAVVQVVGPGLRPAARKMRRVRRELDLLHRRVIGGMGWPLPKKPRSYGIGVPHEDWGSLVAAVDLDAFARAYQVAAHYAQILPAIVSAAEVARTMNFDVEVRPEERLALTVVNLLLADPKAREAVQLPPLPVRRRLDIED